ncbi:MAG: cation:proton antiporter [Desulfuromonadales bacterium]|nr:cation:proton antiporter [Desulfuromonadales bacterium]
MYIELGILALFIFCYSLVAGRIERAAASGPIVFVISGFILGPVVFGWFDGSVSRDGIKVLADLTLALILFIDAANVDFSVLKKQFRLPSRMLLVGLPGVIILGALTAAILFNRLSLLEAAILGTMLAATDAALGKAVVTNKAVPNQIRESLNLESGLNDGLCVPILFLFIALELGNVEGSGTMHALSLLVQELGIGLVVGVGLTAVGTKAFKWCQAKGWVTEIWRQVIVVALAIACFSVAQSLHGSGYIAAFVGGLLFRIYRQGRDAQTGFGLRGCRGDVGPDDLVCFRGRCHRSIIPGLHLGDAGLCLLEPDGHPDAPDLSVAFRHR